MYLDFILELLNFYFLMLSKHKDKNLLEKNLILFKNSNKYQKF